MKMTHSWDFLLWCDPSNYGGIRSAMPKDETEKTNPLEEGNINFDFLKSIFGNGNFTRRIVTASLAKTQHRPQKLLSFA